jgi:hypothetical protein
MKRGKMVKKAKKNCFGENLFVKRFSPNPFPKTLIKVFRG